MVIGVNSTKSNNTCVGIKNRPGGWKRYAEDRGRYRGRVTMKAASVLKLWVSENINKVVSDYWEHKG